MNWLKKLFAPKPPYLKTIHHEDWIFDEFGNNGHVVIPKKEHGKSTYASVQILDYTRYITYTYKDGNIVINRTLPAWQGTPFSVHIQIQ